MHQMMHNSENSVLISAATGVPLVNEAFRQADGAGRAPLRRIARPDGSRAYFLPLLFGCTLFSSAFLLFSVQPMISRMVLPRLGGSPAVWNTCVCFFQAALLLGYLYADWSATRLAQKSQLVLHVCALLGAMLLLPLSMGAALPPAGASPALWLLVRLSLTVGPPFLVIAATAPLLQSWFARTIHRQAQDPYFLYATSNTGSLLALLGYPLAIETTLGLSQQIRLWSVGYVATALLVVGSGMVALFYTAPVRMAEPAREIAAPLPLAQQLRWMMLAFVPSALMLAVTTYITTDIASAPLFWVLPLAIYILTFVVAFGRPAENGRPGTSRRMLALQGAALAAAGVAGMKDIPNLLSLAVALAAFALTASVCHRELAARRPPSRHLTRYFLLISVGGALGGLFNAFAAPLLFRGPWEYPLLLIAACLLRPAAAPLGSRSREDWAARADLGAGFLLCVVALALLCLARLGQAGVWAVPSMAASIIIPFAGLLWFSTRRVRLAFALAGLFLLPATITATSTLASVRSFFGIYRVRSLPAERAVALQHGTTMHGLQSLLPGEERTPLGYYERSGPFGRLFAARDKILPGMNSVGVVGLGTGGLGCYAQRGQKWTFLEIDAAVERLARDDRYFHFMSLCGNHPAVVLGDARITLAAAADVKYDMLIIDAFSSDSVPVHLLTSNAMALYFARLKPGGVLVYHISNRFLNLAPVVARLAQAANAQARHLLYVPGFAGTARHTGAEVVAVALPGASLDWLAADGWDVPTPGPVLWTDERMDILRVIRW